MNETTCSDCLYIWLSVEITLVVLAKRGWGLKWSTHTFRVRLLTCLCLMSQLHMDSKCVLNLFFSVTSFAVFQLRSSTFDSHFQRRYHGEGVHHGHQVLPVPVQPPLFCEYAHTSSHTFTHPYFTGAIWLPISSPLVFLLWRLHAVHLCNVPAPDSISFTYEPVFFSKMSMA